MIIKKLNLACICTVQVYRIRYVNYERIMGRRRKAPKHFATHDCTSSNIRHDQDIITTTPTSPTIFTAQEIQSFQNQGYIHLSQAFSSTIANDIRALLWERLSSTDIGIMPHDRSTWVERHSIAELYSTTESPWKEVMTLRVSQAIDQLCGPNQWEPFGLGWWMINFPLRDLVQENESIDDANNEEWGT